MKLRRRSLGNIRFIGELYKIKMLNGRLLGFHYHFIYN